MTLALSPSRLARALGTACRPAGPEVRVTDAIGDWFGDRADCPIRRPDALQPAPAILVLRPGQSAPPGRASLTTPLDDARLAGGLRRAMRAELDVTLPGTLVLVAGSGVLIRGPAGIGKSETALQLIDRGHRLVSDDAVRIRAGSGDELEGMAPGPSRGRLMVRGLGMIEIERHYRDAFAETAPVSLLLALDDERHEADALLGGWGEAALLGERLCALRLRGGRALPLLLERAVAMLGERRPTTNAEPRRCDW